MISLSRGPFGMTASLWPPGAFNSQIGSFWVPRKVAFALRVRSTACGSSVGGTGASPYDGCGPIRQIARSYCLDGSSNTRVQDNTNGFCFGESESVADWKVTPFRLRAPFEAGDVGGADPERRLLSVRGPGIR